MGIYLVTGTAGFIGAKVTTLLLEAGHTVVGIDNLNDAYDVRLKAWRLAQNQSRTGYHFVSQDICDLPSLKTLFEAYAFDGVINLAARAGVRQSVKNPWVYNQTNADGTLNLLECCRLYEVPKFVLASTSSLYGIHNPRPYTETQDTGRPLSPYAASKKAAEAMCHSYHHLYGIDVTIFRYFTVYGPAGRPDMSLFRFTQWISEGKPVMIFGDGSQSRDFTYVDDIARGTIAGLKKVGYEIFNLGSDTPHGLMETVRLIEEKVGRAAHLEYRDMHPADVMATWANIEKAKAILGWQPETTLAEGIGNLVNWYQANRTWASEIITREA